MNIRNHFPTEELQKRDAAHHLHPFTAQHDLANKGSRIITSAQGVYVYDSNGEELLDAMAGGRRFLAISLRKTTTALVPPEFGALHTLDLSGSATLTAVPGLGNVHSLNLSYCSQLTDVSNLGNVYELDLSNCGSLEDVSALVLSSIVRSSVSKGNIGLGNLSRMQSFLRIFTL